MTKNKISICTTVKNRSVTKYNKDMLTDADMRYFISLDKMFKIVENDNIGNRHFKTVKSTLAKPFTPTKTCFESLLRCIQNNKFLGEQEYELIVADWNSTDCDILKQLPEELNPKVVQINRDGFSRGYGLNTAYKESTGNIIFFTDIDMLFENPFMLEECIKKALEGNTSWPVCYMAKDPVFFTMQPEWAGYGMCIMLREIFEASGHWPELNKWGDEDTILYKRLFGKYPVFRKAYPGYIHQWHSTNLRNTYGKK